MDVGAWLRGLGLGRYEQPFRDNDIDPEVLPELTADDLIGLGIASIGHRRKLLAAIAALRQGAPFPEARAEPAFPAAANAPRSPDAERRQLTVMFVDLVGSTALSTRLDPEDMREVIRAYQDAVAGEVARFEGHVAKFMGDGVLAYFGFPQAHEDDAEHAVWAGLDILGSVGRLRSPEGKPLAARVGIATGLVVVGDLVGSGASREQAVVGETPNLAARLQALAEPDSLVIAAATHRLVGGLFECADLGPVEVKGFAEPVRACCVLGPSAVASRFEALHTALTPLVGREEEVDLLLRRWEQAKGGEGRVVLISSEPGIGKSRLLAAVQERLRGEPHARLRCFCSSHHQDSPLHPVAAQLERAAGFARDDPSEVRLEKLEALLAPIQPSAEDIALLAELLSLPLGDRHASTPLAPQRKRERTFEALLHRLEGLARREPVLMIFEDVHWIDPSSRELLDLAVERVARLPVLLLVTFRPEFESPWTGQPHVTALVLARLGRRDGAALVRRIVGGAALPDDLVAEIVERTDGVPLFLEELAKAVLEAGTEGAGETLAASPPAASAIPATLYASLLARLDRLGPMAREVAQVGAAIGREFPHELLADAASLDVAGLTLALDRLIGAGLVFRRGLPPEAVYVFKHTLVQEAAYASLLKSRRQQLHARVAHVLEEQFPDIIAARPEILAHHCMEAGFLEKALEHGWRAGQAALAQSAPSEAVGHLRKALRLLGLLPDTDGRAERELEIRTALGGALMAGTAAYAAPETGETYDRARELCERLGKTERLVPLMFGQWAVRLTRGELPAARALADEALRLAEGRGDERGLAVAHRLVGVSSLWSGRPEVALAHLEQALARYDPTRDRHSALLYAWDQRVATLACVAVALWQLGYPEQALARSGEALAKARELADTTSLAHALCHSCMLHELLGDGGAAFEQAGALEALCAERRLRFPLWVTMAAVLRRAGSVAGQRTEEAMAQVAQSLRDYQATGSRLLLPYWMALLAKARTGAEHHAGAREALAEAQSWTDRTDQRWIEAELHRLRAGALLRAGPAASAAAEAALRDAIAVARQQAARLWELRATGNLARLWAERGERRKAYDLLAPVYGWFTEGFDTPDLQDARALLDELQ